MASSQQDEMSTVHRTLCTNIHYLICYAEAIGVPSGKFDKLKELLNESMFVRENSNVTGFLETLYFLFYVWNEKLCQEKFKLLWPAHDQKGRSMFLRASCEFLQEINKNHPDSDIPKLSFSWFLQPGGDNWCESLLKITHFVMKSVLEKDGDVMVLSMPDESSTRDEKSTLLLVAKTESLIKGSFACHVSSSSIINESTEAASLFLQNAKKCSEEEKLVSEELANLLTAVKLPGISTERVQNASDSTALDGCKNQIKAKRDHVEYLIGKLRSTFDGFEQFSSQLQRLQSRPVVDGEKLVPEVNSNLASQLNMPEEEIRNKLFEDGQLKLNGLLEIGAKSLKVKSSLLAQRDTTDISAALPQLRSIMEEQKEQLNIFKEIESEQKELLAQLEPLEDALSEKVQALPMPKDLTLQASGSSLLYQIPCTPPFNFTQRLREQESSDCEIKKLRALLKPAELVYKDDTLSYDTLMKIWKGELTEMPSSSQEPAIRVKVEQSLSPKRSHSPGSPRSTLRQDMNTTSAPPPPKDLKLSGMKHKPSSFYTPKFKQSLHNRLLQIPGKSVTRPWTQTPLTKNETGVLIKPEPQVLSTVKKAFPFTQNLSPPSNGTIITLSEDFDSSSDGEIPLGDMSLQEIAALHLSPFSPLHSELSPNLFAQMKPDSFNSHNMSPTVFPQLKTINESPKEESQDVKPFMDTLRQRLQAIKVNMNNQPAMLDLSPVQSTPSNFKRTKVHIKLELETP